MSVAATAAEPATPAMVCLAFAEALDAGDFAAASSCFAREARLITPDATSVSGRLAIRSVLAQITATHPEVTVEASSVLSGEDVALVRQRWRISMEAPTGPPYVQCVDPTMVLRRVEGAWKLAIAAPWGWKT